MQGLLFLPCVPRQIVVGREGCTVALILVTEHTTSVNLNHSQWVFLEIIQTPMMNHIQHTVLQRRVQGDYLMLLEKQIF